MIMNLPKRKLNRLAGYDYSQNNAYFITVCVKGKSHILWNAVDHSTTVSIDDIPLSKIGNFADAAINNISQFYPNACVEKYAIMPNHIHMILLLTENSGSAARSPTVSTIINQLKGFITKQVGYSIWQISFYDHIIRNDEEYRLVWDYIDANPINWQCDNKFGY